MEHLLSDWPIERPRRWLELVNTPQTPEEEAALRRSMIRGRPYGAAPWVAQTARRLSLEQSLHPRGRPTGWRKRQNA